MGALDRLRSNPRWAVVIAATTVLVLAWIAWAIYVASSKGATAGLGVLLAWPAILVALALISLPFLGAYLLIHRLANGDDSTAEAEAEASDADDEEDESEDPAEKDDEPNEGEDSEDDEDDSEEEEGSEESDDEETEEAEAEKASD